MPDDGKRSPAHVEPGTEEEAPDPGAADVDDEELVTVRDLRGGRSRIYRIRLADFLAGLTVEEGARRAVNEHRQREEPRAWRAPSRRRAAAARAPT